MLCVVNFEDDEYEKTHTDISDSVCKDFNFWPCFGDISFSKAFKCYSCKDKEWYLWLIEKFLHTLKVGSSCPEPSEMWAMLYVKVKSLVLCEMLFCYTLHFRHPQPKRLAFCAINFSKFQVIHQIESCFDGLFVAYLSRRKIIHLAVCQTSL